VNHLVDLLVQDFAHRIANGQCGTDPVEIAMMLKMFLGLVEKVEKATQEAEVEAMRGLLEMKPHLQAIAKIAKEHRDGGGFILLLGSIKDKLGTTICSSFTESSSVVTILNSAASELDGESQANLDTA
jgi:hypothetical protein